MSFSGTVNAVTLEPEWGRAHGDEEAGGDEADGWGVDGGGGDAGDVGVGNRGLADGERRGMAVDEGDGGRLAVGELDGEAEAEVGVRTGGACGGRFRRRGASRRRG